MFESKLFDRFYRFGETIYLLLFVNLLWLCFTVLGLGLFGFGPSTVATFTIFRNWSMGKADMPIFQTFWRTYKQEFLKANGLGLFLLAIGYMLYINLNYLELQSVWLFTFIHYLIIFTAIVYGIMLIYIFPMYVHYDNKIITYFKNAIFIAVYKPIRTLYAIAASLTLYYLYFTFPVFIFLFGVSLTCMVIMWITYRTFVRLEIQQANDLENQA